MTLSNELGIVVASISAVAVAAVWAWRTVRQRRKDPIEIERLRRLGVNACGRIVPGRIVELMEPVTNGLVEAILLYEYEVSGVTYEAAQDVSALPEIVAAAPYLPGQTASVKFDPKRPTNSILACEVWHGFPDLDRRRSQHPPGDPPPKLSRKSK